MARMFFFIALVCIGLNSSAQIKDPVKWTFSAKKKLPGEYEVHLTASIGSSWHLYSQTTPAGGPIPTSISFVKNPLVTLVGTAKEVGKIDQRYEPLFKVDVRQFATKVDFVQIVKVKGSVKTNIAGEVEFMVCNDQECLPPKTQKFSIALQ